MEHLAEGSDGADDSDDQAADRKPIISAISNALTLDLSVHRSVAIGKTVAESPFVALCALVATIDGYGCMSSPVKISANGFLPRLARTGAGNFETAFAELLTMPLTDVVERLAAVVGQAVDVRRHNTASEVIGGSVVAALAQRSYEAHAREAFDAVRYFAGVNADLCKRALVEMNGRNNCIATKKAELAAFAANEAKRTGWLPPELRA